MIPVFRLADLKKRPNDPNARQRALDMVKRFNESDEAFRKACKDNNIPYVPAVCASNYGSTYYTSESGRRAQPKLGDTWGNRM